MGKNNIKFDDTEIAEHKFHQHKTPIPLYDININKIVVSNKLPFGKWNLKYLVGYKYAKKNIPLYIFCPKMSKYKKILDKTKCMYFLIKYEKKI